MIWTPLSGTTWSVPADEQAVVLAAGLGVGLRGADADSQLTAPLGVGYVLPAECRDLRAAQASAEDERDDRAVLEAARRRHACGFDAAAGPPGLLRERQEHDGTLERERRGLARRGVGAGGVLAGDAGDEGAHAGCGRWVVSRAGAVRRPDGGGGYADGRDSGRLGALGQIGGDEDGRGREGLGPTGAAPSLEPGPLASVGPAGVGGAGGGRGRDDAGRRAGGGDAGVSHALLTFQRPA